VRVAIVGAGIGGLAAALLLRRAGIDAVVFEQAKALQNVGAGIQISPNASRILHRLGLAEPLGRVAVRPEAVVMRRWDDGAELWRHPLGTACLSAYGAPYYHLHRADLIAALAAALPPAFLRLNQRVTGVEQSAPGVHLRLGDEAAGPFDALVAADGIHSAVRACCWDLVRARPPRFSGKTAYRGLIPAARLARLNLERDVTVWLGPERHLVHYFVAGGRLMNFVAVVPAGDWRVESWSARGEVADAVAEFADWHPQTRAVIGAADQTHRWALYDCDPLDQWAVGRVVLLGDAAHPMLPFLAQGAGQAIEDAAVLAGCLRGATAADVPAALNRYEAIRRPRASAMQALSRRSTTDDHGAGHGDGASGTALDAIYGYDAEVEVLRG
jgi:salicylate hydroxylase